VIDDDTPTPAHARVSLAAPGDALAARGWRCGCCRWADAARFGWQGTLTQMGWFFTKAALLTFGGAYAVLPYVYQGAVEHYGWLTAADDRRPGAGRDHAGAADHGGRLRRFRRRLDVQAAVRPRHAVLLAGARAPRWSPSSPSCRRSCSSSPAAPLVESTHGDLKFTAPLTAITAAVVGVILNLALFFA
jgi:chromate transporter